MLKKQAYRKYAEKVFIDEKDSNIKLKQEVQKFISFSFNFGSNQEILMTLKDLIINANLSRNQMLQIWNQCIHKELKKIKLMLKNIPTQNQNTLKKMQNSMRQKIQACCKSICEIMKRINQVQKWCLCDNPECSVSKNLFNLGSKMKGYLKNQQEGAVVYFLQEGDEKCQEITLSILNQQNFEKQHNFTVIQFLHQLKIPSKRDSCCYDEQWLKDLRQKYSSE